MLILYFISLLIVVFVTVVLTAADDGALDTTDSFHLSIIALIPFLNTVFALFFIIMILTGMVKDLRK